MRRYLSVVILALVTALVAFSQFGCAAPQNSTSNINAVATPEPTPDKTAIERELLRIENDFPRVLKERDADAIRRVEADDLVEILPDGSTSTKEQDVADIQAGNTSADSWEVVDAKVTVLDAGAAFVTGRTVVKGGKSKGPDGKSVDISGEYRFLDTFARRDGQWKLVATAILKIKNPGASPTPKASPSPGASPAMKPTPAAKGTPAPKPSPAAKASPVMKPMSTPMRMKTP
jgi:ketosteroid isomerase-like protein